MTVYLQRLIRLGKFNLLKILYLHYGTVTAQMFSGQLQQLQISIPIPREKSQI